MGLAALQENVQQRTGLPFTFIGDWQNQVDHLLFQEEAKRNWKIVPVHIPQDEQQDTEECNMSMRANVDKTAIESFLQQLELTYHLVSHIICLCVQVCDQRLEI